MEILSSEKLINDLVYAKTRNDKKEFVELR